MNYQKFLQENDWIRRDEATQRLEAAGNPGGFKAARLCYPPPVQMNIATTLHALIFSVPFLFINPLLGVAFVLLVFGISIGYTWPKWIKTTLELDPTRERLTWKTSDTTPT